MSKKNDEAPFIIRNTSGKHKIWDIPAGAQHRDNPLPHTIMMKPDSSVRLTPEQYETMGKPPDGFVVERYDEKKHGKRGIAGK